MNHVSLATIEIHMHSQLIIWSIFADDFGDYCGQIEELHQWLFSQNHITLQIYTSDDALSSETSDGAHPDLILIHSSRRGEFSRKMLQAIVGKYPLALVFEITGEWCIGDTRSGHPLPIACRMDAAVSQQRIPAMLASRQHFMQVRASVKPLANFGELSAFWNRGNLRRSHRNKLNVIASNRVEGRALRTLLFQEGFTVDLHPSGQAIAKGNRCGPIVYCLADRRELRALTGETISSPIVIITSHFNDLDKTHFADGSPVTFMRKPFLGHDLVHAITNGHDLADAKAA